MKTIQIIASMILALTLLSGCAKEEPKTTSEKMKESASETMERTGDYIEEKAEDAGDAIEDGADAVEGRCGQLLEQAQCHRGLAGSGLGRGEVQAGGHPPNLSVLRSGPQVEPDLAG